MSDYNQGDTLTISTASYSGRKFTVVGGNGHRTLVVGKRGARRVLVVSEEVTEMKDGGLHRVEMTSIHEDDGERNRGRPCTVNRIERSPVGPLASVKLGDARTSPTEPFKIEPSEPWINEAARDMAAALKKHRPITAMEIAMLMRCTTPREVAEWVIERDISQACVTGDQHAADNGAAMKLYLSSLEIRRLSGEAK